MSDFDPAEMDICRSCSFHFLMRGFVYDQPPYDVCSINHELGLGGSTMLPEDCVRWPVRWASPEQETPSASQK